MAERVVHIVDDDAPFRDSLRLMLAGQGYDVLEFSGGRVFADTVGDAPDGCALVDVNMPDLNGLALQELLNSRSIAMPVIIMTGVADVPTAVRAMKAGAVDFIEKPFELATVLDAIETALSRALPPAPPDDPLVAAFRSRLPDLTPREREILEAVVAGSPTKVIAYDLDISPRTVHVHRARIGDKLGVTGLSNLVRLALAAGVTARTAVRRANRLP
ncbi:MAG: response regulator [Rhodospirillaceae bacterium]